MRRKCLLCPSNKEGFLKKKSAYSGRAAESFDDSPILSSSLPGLCYHCSLQASDRVRHSNWIDFWYQGSPHSPNPQRSEVMRKLKAKSLADGDLKRPIPSLRKEKYIPHRNVESFEILGVSSGSSIG